MQPLNSTIISLQKENPLHLRLMYEVRTNPKVAICLTMAPPTDYESHVRYVQGVGEDKRFFIIVASQVLCGYCQATIKKNEIELGWAIHPDWWGKSIGSAAVTQLILLVNQEYPNQSKKICLTVKKNNYSAIHIYKKNGFVISSSDNLNNLYPHLLK